MLLKLNKPYIKDPAVKRVQEMLRALGHNIAVDGFYGPATESAVASFQAHSRRSPTGCVSDGDFKALEAAVNCSVDNPRLVDAPKIVDISNNHTHPSLYNSYKSPRPWSSINGVTLHQTAISLAETEKRWYTLCAHIGVLKNGTIYVVNNPQDFIWHAQRLSMEISQEWKGILKHYGRKVGLRVR